MSNPSSLFRFRIDLSDVDRGVYESLDFRVAMHPSEAPPFLLTRVLAYALNIEPGLEFSPGGLSDPDEPCLRTPDPRGGLSLWIEIGSPSARRLHKASKAAKKVKVYTYKDPRNLVREVESGDVHKVEEIEMYSLEPSFLDRLATTLQRDNKWGLVHTEGSLVINIGERTEQGELTRLSMSQK